MRTKFITALGALAVVAATPAVASAQAETHYTHRTTLTRDCRIHENFPKPGVPDRSWAKKRGGAVGVRYTYKGYALVLDYSKNSRPNWGFINRSCLGDSSAYSGGDRGTPVQDLQAIGGDNQLTTVPISSPPADTTRRALIRPDSVGSVRSAPASFVIGNVRAGDPFYLTTAACGSHGPTEWILGYAPNSGRWGYVEAMHLPACR
ncbi:hypothetical protein [Nonomuraea gerenzanensis]|uniref:SH3b domain-containing protein n=1 Tax=Nonomuraea gerenzanensis TaxID=93944 RepID=A0A1M4EMC9_9ACTN|nr:hypothetical protein [Nonomuraea gerenzanensis]UBU11489.1 hypothetical protein LCN96_45425 [Nonomuraea gerenzanensis]SBO99975.1 hypothetical protein BN4615_P9491 [Nonomuraea gerenzanensis]